MHISCFTLRHSPRSPASEQVVSYYKKSHQDSLGLPSLSHSLPFSNFLSIFFILTLFLPYSLFSHLLFFIFLFYHLLTFIFFPRYLLSPSHSLVLIPSISQSLIPTPFPQVSISLSLFPPSSISFLTLVFAFLFLLHPSSFCFLQHISFQPDHLQIHRRNT